MGEEVGDFIWEGLCHRGNYVVKNIRVDYVHHTKFVGGGGLCSHIQK